MGNYPILNPISALFSNYLTDKRPISRPVVWLFGSSAADCLVLNVKALVGAFNQEKALVGAFSVIVKSSGTFG